jgi:Fe-S oxidoreductase/nitrate reductase gamma subunit
MVESMVPGREIYWNISGYVLQYLFFLCSLAVFVYGMWRRYRKWRIGRPEDRSGNLRMRLMSGFNEILSHKRIFHYPYTGIFHYSVVAGFLMLFLGTTAVFIEADLGIRILSGSFYLYFQSLLLDVAGALVLAGIGMALFQRFVRKPQRFQNMSSGLFALIGLSLLLASGFLVEGLRISATADPWGRWSPVGYAVSLPFAGIDIEIQKELHRIFWWFHMALAFALLAYLPFSKLRHILLGPLNIYFRRLDPKGVTVDPINMETAEKLGAELIVDLSWKHLLDLDACTECGRCQEVCPVSLSLQPFSPRDVIVGLRNSLDRSTQANPSSGESAVSAPRIVEAIGNETIWLCRTCRACMEACPMFIEHIPKFVEPRRFEVMEKAELPKTLKDPIESLESRRHAYRGTPVSRTDWFKGLDIPLINENAEVELLYWVGCTTALNEDNWEIARSLSGLLKQADIPFGVLGDVEICCGEPARRIGNEYLFETIARENIEILDRYRFKAMITSCPHCFNMLRNEYRDFQRSFTIYHHSEYLWKLLDSNRLKIQNVLDRKITYHDPCYLGRYNDSYDMPRALIERASGSFPTEMQRSRSRSFCCGGGGGGCWLGEEKFPVENRLNVRRAHQAAETGADVLATACPFCMMMMRDGIKTVSESNVPAILDVAEILHSACRRTR